MTLVTVVMPSYNSAEWVVDAARSVLAQTHTDLELLVVDDASSDSSVDVLADLAAQDDRVDVAVLPENGGAARARNHALARARGDHVAFLDSDDLWLPEKLERQLRFADETGAPLTYTSYYRLDGEAARTTPPGESVAEVVRRCGGRVVEPPAQVDHRRMLEANYIGSPTAMFDRRHYGTRLMPDLRKRQDYAMWLSLLREGGTARGLLEPLSVYRVREGSLSRSKVQLASWNWRLYREVEGLSVPRAAVSLGRATLRSLRNARG